MREVLMTAQFKSDLDGLDNSIRKRVGKTLRQIEHDPYQPGLESHSQASIHNRKVMRSRVNENFRILWEWIENGNILLWRIGSHKMIDAINYIRSEPREQWKIFARDDSQAAIELESLEVSRDLPQPFKHVPANILRLFGVPDSQLESVKLLANEEAIWDAPIPENVQSTLLDILTNPDWTVKDLLNTDQLRFRTTVDQLEGYCAGRIKQLLLNLNDEQQSFVTINTNGPLLIKGVAGSGKTTIGLYRANFLAQKMDERRRLFGEGSSILLLTFTETLTKALRQLYSELYGQLPHTIAVTGYKEWMLKQLRANGIWLAEANENTRCEIVGRAQKDVAQLHPHDKVVSARPAQYLLEEIDQVIRARGLESFEQYQSIERVGRGIGLDRERHRPIVWKIYQRYQQELDRRKLFDWADLARLVQKHCAPLPQYDVVIIDEAQDMPPSDLRLATRLITDYNESRSLTLLADPAQSIYYRGIAWKEAGINIQGRTRILARNYRNTQQILEAARSIVERCDDLKAEEEYIAPASVSRRGPKPIVVRYSNSAASNQFLANEIIRLCQAGRYRPGDIAVLSRGKTLLTKYIVSFLKQQDILCRFHRDQDFHILDNEVKLVTMHSAKGLEFPVVFLIGLSDRYMPFISPDSDTKREDELQERKLFYVSMTRAAELLYLMHPQRERCRFLYELDPDTVITRDC